MSVNLLQTRTIPSIHTFFIKYSFNTKRFQAVLVTSC